MVEEKQEGAYFTPPPTSPGKIGLSDYKTHVVLQNIYVAYNDAEFNAELLNDINSRATWLEWLRHHNLGLRHRAYSFGNLLFSVGAFFR